MPDVPSPKLGNVPFEVTSFVGRRWEIAEIKRRLADTRLMTLTGLGGTGKTRLAVRVAGEIRRTFPDGVWFVDLSQLEDPGRFTHEAEDPDVLAHVIAATLGLREPSGEEPLRLLTEQLARRRMLLILDNCEHVKPACAVLAESLMRTCPGLMLLATSREPLHVAGEEVIWVPPLPIPDSGHRSDLAKLGQCESVSLFVARAQAALPGFTLTEENCVAVADLCQRLDGLPLAIELAAARTRALAPQQILLRLSDRFALLSRGPRSAPERHQTLRACVDWSYDLCAKPERLLWARLAVFSGGFELDGVEGICADQTLPAGDLPDLVAALVDKSIVIRDDHGAYVRYRMLDTIREYGLEKLRVGGDEAMMRHRHRDWFEQLVARARSEWISARQVHWLARLNRAHHNMRAAVEYSLAEPGEAEAALRLVAATPGHYWWARGLFGEVRTWLCRALEQSTPSSPLYAHGLLMAGHLAFVQGDPRTGMRLLAEGESLAKRLGGEQELAYACVVRAVGALFQNQLTAAMAAVEQGLARLSRSREPDLDLRLNLLFLLVMAAGLTGDQERASAAQRELLAITSAHGESFYRSSTVWAGGVAAWRRGDLRAAATQVTESLLLTHGDRFGDGYGIALCLKVLAWISASERLPTRAATLLGAARGIWAELDTPFSAYQHLVEHDDACEREIRRALSEAAFDEAIRGGRDLPLADAVAYALEGGRSESPPTTCEPATPLTRRERQIADLVAKGMSNKEIAATLVISQRTVESHVEHILGKLGFTSRTQVAAWVVTQRPTDDLR